MSAFIVGLTGGIGSGKSSVATLFAALGVPVIDADLVARELSAPGQPCYNRIVANFGTEILKSDGTLDRARLGNIIFADTEKKRLLEEILHPAIRREMQERAAGVKSPYCLFEIPLLVENGLEREVNRVLVVEAEESSRIARVKARNDLSERHIRRIIATQASKQARQVAADDLIDNNGQLAELQPQVERLHRKYLVLAGSIAGNGIG